MIWNDQEPHLAGTWNVRQIPGASRAEEPGDAGKGQEGSRVIDFVTAREQLSNSKGFMKGGTMFPETDDEGFL